MGRWVLVAIGLLLGVALAAGLDARGWTQGQVAAGLSRTIGPASDEPVAIELPASLLKRIKGPTLLVYFSPRCPHCRHVAPELAALAKELTGKVAMIAVATGSSESADIAEFMATFGLEVPVVHDTDGQIGSAIQARSTPSALLVRREGKGVVVDDLWYPYSPGTDVLVKLRAAGDVWSLFEPGKYLGNRACGACHTQETESWLLTHHSVAWATLVRKENEKDPACVGCHVTGDRQPGGWTPGNEVLVDVGCEACHGAGGPHDGTRTDPVTTCAGCHDAKHSINFSVAKGMPLIDHFRTNGLDASDWRAEVEKLHEGKAPRALLAFEGEYVGSTACATCHAAEQAHWKSGPHAAAMGSLARHKEQGNGGCVKCHATPKATGALGDDPSRYRPEEGVGCESCHGPGGAHVAAGGGTENIVGLGASCPVCVIEAVCTSCHNEAWDPLWDLDKKLPKVKHSTSAQ